ncbi:hypothetical protein ACS0PU_007340 [Formica fusca]
MSNEGAVEKFYYFQRFLQKSKSTTCRKRYNTSWSSERYAKACHPDMKRRVGGQMTWSWIDARSSAITSSWTTRRREFSPRPPLRVEKPQSDLV